MNNLLNQNCLSFKKPFRLMVAGPSCSGKTVLVRNILRSHQELFSPETSTMNVIWCYGQWQKSFAEDIDTVNIEYVSGLINENELKEMEADLIVIDDLMCELSDNVALSNLFTKLSHHLNISVIFIVQNLFHQGKQMRNIHTNYDYLIVMRNTRDRNQIDKLGQQMKRRKALLEAYADATNEPYGYLLIDFSQTTPEKLMFRTNIFPENNIKGNCKTVIYSPI